jgi:CRISPR system Cascade subunit CasE
MILSRICLNPMHSDTYRFASDPYRIHQALTACASLSRQEASILFRMDDGPTLIVQSDTELNWEKLGLREGALLQEPQSKAFDPSIRVGQQFGFRLRCNPAKKVKVEGKKNSQFKTIRDVEGQIEWLKSKGGQFGFSLLSVEHTHEEWTDTKPPKSGDGIRKPRVSGTRFDGELIVTDTEKFREGLAKGIGPQKAYGFGLLSLKSVRA